LKPEEIEGVGDGNAADYRLNAKLGWDFNWHTTRRGAASLRPFFKTQILEELPDGSRKILTGWGVIEIEKPGVVSISGECDYTLKDRKAYEELYKPKMQFTEERVDPKYFNENDWDKIDGPVGLELGSIAGDVRNMLTVMGMSYMIYDDYDLLDEKSLICRTSVPGSKKNTGSFYIQIRFCSLLGRHMLQERPVIQS
jgi:uroporphyrinogen decarboxylase